jgi:DNA helicase-2/ATP-dependent DNA helicase PcrA
MTRTVFIFGFRFAHIRRAIGIHEKAIIMIVEQDSASSPDRTVCLPFDAHQQAAIEVGHGYALLLAGAGSGKTASIIGRARYLVESGVSPAQILLVTFSRKAAQEMRSRAAAHIGPRGKAMQIDTFHGFCRKFLSQHAEMVRPGHDEDTAAFHATGSMDLFYEPEQDIEAAPGQMTTLDETGETRLVRAAVAQIYGKDTLSGLDWKGWQKAYDRLRSEGLTVSGKGPDTPDHAFLHAWQQASKPEVPAFQNAVWVFARRYEHLKLLENVVDFGDLINLTLDILVSNKSLRHTEARRFRYIMVDESQDMDRAQYRLILLLAEAMSKPSLMLVGDDDQAIYGFRGARPSLLRDYTETHKPQVIRLERNYRSTDAIVASAASHIQHNRLRLPKSPFSQRNSVDSVHAYSHASDMRMLDWIVEHLQEQHDKGRPWNDFAVLYRGRILGPQLSAQLTRYRIPFEIFGSRSFFEYLEVRFVIACAGLVANPRDLSALHAVSPLLKGVGDKVLKGIEDVIWKHPQATIWGAAKEYAQGQRNGSKVLRRMQELQQQLIALHQGGPLRFATNCWALQGLGMLAHFSGVDQKIGRSADEVETVLLSRRKRLEFLDLLIADTLSDGDAFDSPFTAIAELGMTDADPGEVHDRVVLSTVHGVKGMEFREVHIPGFVAPFMPSRRHEGAGEGETPAEAQEQAMAEEEERRISYVALTRAIDQLYLHIPLSLVLPGTKTRSGLLESSYLSELRLTHIPAPTIVTVAPDLPPTIVETPPPAAAEQDKIIQFPPRLRVVPRS